MYKIPILFVIFKRKEVSLRAFAQIKKVKPIKLYIACDGARPHVEGEAEMVEATRKAILDTIDWECDVHTNFQKTNLGCGMGVFTAINWLFENEERGIVIEDDCVMRDSFFPFVEEMLERYADDTRIGLVDGANYLEHVDIPDSYVFSQYKSTNGWASWRRAWRLMDIDMSWRGTKYELSVINNMGYKSKNLRYWKHCLKSIDLNDVSAWDWQWYFALAANNMLSITPKYNLTTNIGFGKEATHTNQSSIPSQYISTRDISFPLQHPKFVVPYQPYEQAFCNSYNTLFNRIKWLFPFWFKNLIKRMVRG